MTAGLEGLGLPRPSEKALRDLRRRLGPAPVKVLFETVAVPLASPRTPGVAYRGLRTVAFDGLNSVKVPDSDRNRSWLGKTMTHLGIAGYHADRGAGRDRHPGPGTGFEQQVHLGHRLRAARKLTGLTMEQAAAAAGLTRNTS